jgi:UDP-GlcNAc:undecaprenyl-phosphate/decaprenyl-phosphate GlcNAc-1-phosphate transferase
MNVMQIVLPVACSGMLSAALCYCFARCSGRLRLVAKPRPDRWHETPTPNTGGVGILIGCAAAYLLFAGSGYRTIAVCAALVSLMGFIDDRVRLIPIAKLTGQAVAAAAVIMSGIALHWTPWLWINVIVTALWIIGITNALNLIDNMDGLCGGVAIIVAGSGAILASLEQDSQRALLLTIIAAACVGFLIFNHKPARIFMGDCGSMFLGFSLASLAAASSRQNTSTLESLYALPAFFYPMFDMGLVSVLRLSAGTPISTGGRDHSSHRLVYTGLAEREAVWILWVITGICAVYGPLAYHHPAWFLFITASLVPALALFGRFLALLPGFGVQPQTRPARLGVQFLQGWARTKPARVAVLPGKAGADPIAVYAKASDPPA